MTQYQIWYNGRLLATGYRYTDALQVQVAIARQSAGIVTIVSYKE